jgi:hypothetical protein
MLSEYHPEPSLRAWIVSGEISAAIYLEKFPDRKASYRNRPA